LNLILGLKPLRRRRIKKQRTFVDDRGRLVTEDYSSTEEIEESSLLEKGPSMPPLQKQPSMNRESKLTPKQKTAQSSLLSFFAKG
jgi:hypothetical protein